MRQRVNRGAPGASASAGEQRQVDAAHQPGPQDLAAGERVGDPAGGLRDHGVGREDQCEGAVGRAGAQVGTQHRGLGGHGLPHRLDDRGVVERVRAGPVLGQGQQHRSGQLEGDGPGEVEHHRVRLLVRGGLQRLVQGYGDGARLRVPAGQRVGGGEGGRARRSPAWSVGTAMSLVFSRRSPAPRRPPPSFPPASPPSSTSPSTATTGTSSRAPRSAARTGPTAVRSSAQAARAAVSSGEAVPSSSEKPGSGMFLSATRRA